MDARELLAGLAAVEIARTCAVSLDTARRWKRRGQLPPGMHTLLELTAQGELGQLAHAWRGWHLVARTGELVSPEGWAFTPGEIRAIPLQHGRIAGLEHQVRQLVATVESRADRRERLEALAVLGGVIAQAERALVTLRADLTEREKDRLFELQRAQHPPRPP